MRIDAAGSESRDRRPPWLSSAPSHLPLVPYALYNSRCTEQPQLWNPNAKFIPTWSSGTQQNYCRNSRHIHGSPSEQIYQKRSLRVHAATILHLPGLAVLLSALDGLAGLLDLVEDSLVGQVVVGNDFGGLSFEGDVEGVNTYSTSAAGRVHGTRGVSRAGLGHVLTVKLLEHALDGTRAAATAHLDVELVCVSHVVCWVCCVGLGYVVSSVQLRKDSGASEACVLYWACGVRRGYVMVRDREAGAVMGVYIGQASGQL